MSILLYETYALKPAVHYMLVAIRVREVYPTWPIKLRWGTCTSKGEILASTEAEIDHMDYVGCCFGFDYEYATYIFIENIDTKTVKVSFWLISPTTVVNGTTWSLGPGEKRISGFGFVASGLPISPYQGTPLWPIERWKEKVEPGQVITPPTPIPWWLIALVGGVCGVVITAAVTREKEKKKK